MNCSGCSPIHPIEEQGILYLRPISPVLLETLQAQTVQVVPSNDFIQMQYLNKEVVRNVLEEVGKANLSLHGSFEVQVTPLHIQADPDGWIRPQMLESRIRHAELVSIILGNQFSSHMQPIVDVYEQIIGFEFLLRPAENGKPFNPYELFEVARNTGLQSYLDRKARITAIETSAECLPHGVKRFVNFLPSSINNPASCLTHTFNAIERLELDPRDFVFEMVETEQVQHISMLQYIFETYRSRGISVALDDVGSGFSTLELMGRLEPDFVKIDRSLIDHCDLDENRQRKIADIVELSRRFGGRVLAEGIERIEEFDYCRSVGIELAQGYYFGKPSSRPPEGPYRRTTA